MFPLCCRLTAVLLQVFAVVLVGSDRLAAGIGRQSGGGGDSCQALGSGGLAPREKIFQKFLTASSACVYAPPMSSDLTDDRIAAARLRYEKADLLAREAWHRYLSAQNEMGYRNESRRSGDLEALSEAAYFAAWEAMVAKADLLAVLVSDGNSGGD